MQAQGVVREVVGKLLVSALAAEEALTRPGLPKQAVTANAAAGGAIMLQNPMSLGATALATTGPVYVVGSTPVATTSGIAIKAT